jgi:hypothetical protein
MNSSGSRESCDSGNTDSQKQAFINLDKRFNQSFVYKSGVVNPVNFAQQALEIAKANQIKNKGLGTMVSRKSLQTNQELIKVEHMLDTPKKSSNKNVENNLDILNDQRDLIEKIVRKRMRKMNKVLKPIEFLQPVTQSMASPSQSKDPFIEYDRSIIKQKGGGFFTPSSPNF